MTGTVKCKSCRSNLLKEMSRIQNVNVPPELKFVVILELDYFRSHCVYAVYFQALIFIENTCCVLLTTELKLLHNETWAAGKKANNSPLPQANKKIPQG